MMSITEKDKEFLLKFLPDAEALMRGDVNKLLTALDDLILMKGFDRNENYNDFGREAQKVYDRIYLYG